MEGLIIFGLGVMLLLDGELFWYIAIVLTVSYFSFSYFVDVMKRASETRRAYFHGSEKIDHADESLDLYMKIGPVISLFLPIVPIIAVFAALNISRKLDRPLPKRA